MNWKEYVYNRKSWSIIFLIMAIICFVGFYRSKNSKANSKDNTDRNFFMSFFVLLIVAIILNPELLHLFDIFRGFRL
jgi:ABC-type transport system involved in multi-copper enzyme maturation permease subunit